MISEHCRGWREQLGVLAFEGLDRGEEAALRPHLEGCAECQAELRELTEIVGLLEEAAPLVGSVDGMDTGALRDLSDRVVDRVAKAQRRERFNRWRPRLATATGIAAAIAATAVITASLVTPTKPPTEAVTLASVQPGVVADASFVNHTWGVELKLVVVDGLQPGQRYDVTFVDVDGAEVDAGGFVGVADRVMTCNLNVDLLREQVAAFAVTRADGERVLSARFV